MSCCPFGGGDVGWSTHWHAECFTRVMFRSGFLAIQFWAKRADQEIMRHVRSALPRLRQEKEEPQSKRKKLCYGTERPNLSTPGQGGVDSRPAASTRETDPNRIGTEHSEFQGTPIAFDERGYLHDSDGLFKFILIVLQQVSLRLRVGVRVSNWKFCSNFHCFLIFIRGAFPCNL